MSRKVKMESDTNTVTIRINDKLSIAFYTRNDGIGVEIDDDGLCTSTVLKDGDEHRLLKFVRKLYRYKMWSD